MVLFLSICVGGMTGCATMFGDSNNKSVKVNSNVENASIYVDGHYYGSTQTGTMMINLDGGENHSITVKKPGYRSVTIPVNREVQGVYYLNIPLLFFFIIPGVVGFVVDSTTDNMYKYEPVNVNLEK